MLLRRFFCFWITVSFVFTLIVPPQRLYAQTILDLPEPGQMVSLSPAYNPAIIRGMTIHKDNPFLFDFIVDIGQDRLKGDALKKESEKLIKYFLASLAIPEKDLWVNLSPYEKGRIIPEALSQTEMGRDLLTEDYLLKQLTASLIYPERQLGKKFWDKVYSKARQLYGTTQVPVNTFNKVWIMADKAEVFERNQTAFVMSSHLKAMLEQDYLALSHNVIPAKVGIQNKNDISALGSQIVRDVILPEIEKEVNTGKNFANLRQVFNSLILASWYKNNLKEALLNQVYTNKEKVKGIDLQDKTVKEQIYQRYLQAYKKGVFNYIKEESFPPLDGDGQGGVMIPRKYFSGGVDAAMAEHPEVRTTNMDAESVARDLSPSNIFTVRAGALIGGTSILEKLDRAQMVVGQRVGFNETGIEEDKIIPLSATTIGPSGDASYYISIGFFEGKKDPNQFFIRIYYYNRLLKQRESEILIYAGQNMERIKNIINSVRGNFRKDLLPGISAQDAVNEIEEMLKARLPADAAMTTTLLPEPVIKNEDLAYRFEIEEQQDGDYLKVNGRRKYFKTPQNEFFTVTQLSGGKEEHEPLNDPEKKDMLLGLSTAIQSMMILHPPKKYKYNRMDVNIQYTRQYLIVTINKDKDNPYSIQRKNATAVKRLNDKRPLGPDVVGAIMIIAWGALEFDDSIPSVRQKNLSKMFSYLPSELRKNRAQSFRKMLTQKGLKLRLLDTLYIGEPFNEELLSGLARYDRDLKTIPDSNNEELSSATIRVSVLKQVSVPKTPANLRPVSTVESNEKMERAVKALAQKLEQTYPQYNIPPVTSKGEKKSPEFRVILTLSLRRRVKADDAMTTRLVPKAETRGGIDLNTSNVNWKISKDGKGVEISIDRPLIERIQRKGIDSLTLVIFRITPITNVWTLVGLQAP